MTIKVLRYADIFGNFRLALTTGLEKKAATVAWSEREILRCEVPAYEVIELSLASRQPYSQVIYLLSEFVGERDYTLALRLLLTRAGLLFEQNPGCAPDLIQGLRLLLAEEFIHHDLKTRLITLNNGLELHQQGRLSKEELAGKLADFLDEYTSYRKYLADL